MIKDAEVAMVNAATYALEAQERNIGASVDEVIKHFLNDSSYGIKSELKIYSVAAINEVLKLKRAKENRGKTNKQPGIAKPLLTDGSANARSGTAPPTRFGLSRKSYHGNPCHQIARFPQERKCC